MLFGGAGGAGGFGTSVGGRQVVDLTTLNTAQGFVIRIDSGATGQTIFGAQGDDTLFGNGDDTLAGRDGNGRLEGEANEDRLAGDAGDDSLDGGQGLRRHDVGDADGRRPAVRLSLKSLRPSLFPRGRGRASTAAAPPRRERGCLHGRARAS